MPPSAPTPAMRPTRVPVALQEILPAGTGAGPAGGLSITGVSLDSRAVQPGDLYAALPGHITHGARFASSAVSAGAVAVVTDAAGEEMCRGLGVPVVVLPSPRLLLGDIASRAYGEPSHHVAMIGVTGTNGKTTVATMVDAGLAESGRVTGVIGTVGVRVAQTWHRAVRTTPEAPDLHAILAVMRESGVDTVVMEVSSIAIEERRVDGVRYALAAFTNLSQDHLDYHGSMETYYEAKAELFTAARAEQGIVGIDDAWGRRLAAEAGIPVRTWSLLDPHADWHAVRDGRDVWVVGPDGERTRLVVPLPGSFNVANAVCAFAILQSSGVPAQLAAAGIAGVEVPGRMQVVSRLGGVVGIVDYAHSPDAVERVLRAARDEVAGRVIVVLGAGGDRDRGKRSAMGQSAARLADVLVITDDNPRSEDPSEIRQAIREGGQLVAPADRAQIREEGDRMEAITVAVGMAEAGDVVLVLGKGHEQGQETAGVVTPFDDSTALREALGSRLAT